MNERSPMGMEDRIRRLERALKLVVSGWLLAAAAVALYLAPWRANAQTANAPQSLRVSELVVVDPQGVERVRIGGDLPDAVINGKRIPRGEKVAGVMLYDGSGPPMVRRYWSPLAERTERSRMHDHREQLPRLRDHLRRQ